MAKLASHRFRHKLADQGHSNGGQDATDLHNVHVDQEHLCAEVVNEVDLVQIWGDSPDSESSP